jgi:hypothetical protein
MGTGDKAEEVRRDVITNMWPSSSGLVMPANGADEVGKHRFGPVARSTTGRTGLTDNVGERSSEVAIYGAKRNSKEQWHRALQRGNSSGRSARLGPANASARAVAAGQRNRPGRSARKQATTAAQGTAVMCWAW